MSSLARFSLPQYERMVETGVFAGEFSQRVELICGEIRQMNPIGHPHATVVDFLNAWSFRSSALEKLVRIQETIRLPDSGSAPEPDVVWAVEKGYTNHPQGSDVLLLVEVADTTLRVDCGEKARLYAESRIPEYWVVDIEGRKLIVHRDPSSEGYRDTRELAGDEEISPLCDPEARLRVGDLFAKLQSRDRLPEGH